MIQVNGTHRGGLSTDGGFRTGISLRQKMFLISTKDKKKESTPLYVIDTQREKHLTSSFNTIYVDGNVDIEKLIKLTDFKQRS